MRLPRGSNVLGSILSMGALLLAGGAENGVCGLRCLYSQRHYSHRGDDDGGTEQDDASEVGE